MERTGDYNLLTTGQIIKGVAGRYEVLSDGIVHTCLPRGIFRKTGEVPLVGDIVDFENGVIHRLHKRNNQLRRPLVANVELCIIVMATAQPAFHPRLLDNFLLLAEYEDLDILICINKAELHPDLDISAFCYYPKIFTSVTTGQGLDELRRHMSGRLCLFAGPSGVGKSSLINALNPELNLQTGLLSQKLARGKHTTRHTEIFSVGDARVFDTPGFTALDISHIKKDEIARLFAEFRPFSCKFTNCRHISEQDCEIKRKVAEGVIPAKRYAAYVEMIC